MVQVAVSSVDMGQQVRDKSRADAGYWRRSPDPGCVSEKLRHIAKKYDLNDKAISSCLSIIAVVGVGYH